MVGYVGRHTCKQFMKSKPIKWGYKLWILPGSDGYPYHVIPYQGRTTQSRQPLGYSVVISMVEVMEKMEAHLPSHTISKVCKKMRE